MTSPTIIKMSTPRELAQAIPMLCGFTPERSLVVLAMAGSRLVVSARYDTCFMSAASLVPITAQRDIDSVVVVAYSDQLQGALDEVDHLIEVCPVPVKAAFSVAGGRIAPHGEHPERASEAIDPDGPAAVALLAEGRTVRKTRAALTLEAAFAGTALGQGQPLPVDEVGAALVAGIADDAADVVASLVGDKRVRDTVLARVAMLDHDGHQRATYAGLALMRGLADDDPRLPELIGIVGMLAWVAGEGAITNVVLERIEQRSSLGVIVEGMTMLGIDPARARDLLIEADRRAS